MKNRFLLFVILVLFALILTDQARGEQGKLGLGINYPGIQLRYDQLEFKVQFGALNTILAGRGYFPITQIPVDGLNLNPYWGIEGGWILSSYLKGGVEGGGFAGVEVEINRNIKLNADIGLYLVDVWGKGNVLDIGLVTNLGVYYYF